MVSGMNLFERILLSVVVIFVESIAVGVCVDAVIEMDG